MKPMIIDFDKNRYENFLSELETGKAVLKTFVQDLQNIVAVDVTQPMFDDFLTDSGDLIAEAIRAEVEGSTGIPSLMARERMADELVNDYHSLRARTLEQLRNFSEAHTGTLAQCLLIKDGTLHLSDSAIKGQKKRFERTITTPEGVALLEAQKAVIEAVNEVLRLSHGNIWPQRAGMLWEPVKPDDKTLRVKIIDYDTLAKQPEPAET